MKLPRFKEVEYGACPPSMSVSEYEECLQINEVRNGVRRFLNNVLSLIEKMFGK